jgi:UDP-N-acetylglucosamine--N-acetylmuramyl-(pentapeptide) pyrophosphoryl-undecaprenol N-acetylglucosamine transferase
MQDKRTIVLTGGGTAGHINPALALAEELISRGYNVVFAGTPGGIESRLVPEAGIEFIPFEASGFNRNHPLTLFKGIFTIFKSSRKAKHWLADIKPAAVVGFGGYVSLPVARAAEALKIPLVVHEQNSVAGIANKELAKRANAVCVTYAQTAGALKAHARADAKVEVTGNPVRRAVYEKISGSRQAAREAIGVPNDATMLLVFGGSLGARHINEAVAALKSDLLARPDLFVYHVTGPKEYDTVATALALDADEQTCWRVVAYENDMPTVLAAADATISRAGATSLAELAVAHLPALLVPYPFATEDHQTTNARAYVDSGAAFMIADDALDTPDFAQKLAALIDDAALREKMREAAAAQNAQNASQNLADVVCALAD